MSANTRVLIVGAGLAGLACARRLVQANLSCTVFEASDDVGGRVRTDRVEGFQLDRGFQVFLSGYPEARSALDYSRLRLWPFHPGALIRYGGRFHRFSDPLRRPQDVLSTLMSPIGSFRDKLTVLRLRQDALHNRLCASEEQNARSTQELLEGYGFSPSMLTRFFRPFLGGVFLERDLQTPCRLFEFVWAAFSRGAIALPQGGMGAIARQVADTLPAGSIRLKSPVRHADATGVVLESGERVPGDVLVLATDFATAAALRGDPVPAAPARAATCLYFEAPTPPVRGPWLIVNGEGEGPVRTASVLSEVAPAYAPVGRSLVSLSLSDDWDKAATFDEIQQALWRQLRDWFGTKVNAWRLLRTDHIPGALPPIALLKEYHRLAVSRVRPGLYQCGDYCETGTLDGALVSGRKAAEALLADQAFASRVPERRLDPPDRFPSGPGPVKDPGEMK